MNVKSEVSVASEFISESEESNDRNILQNFIKTYEIHPELWNPSNALYLNKTKRNEALERLLKIYKRIKPRATVSDVRRKINTLRCNYRKELKKIITSQRTGCGTYDGYTPTSWVFYSLKFLNQFEQPVNKTSRQQDNTIVQQDESRIGQNNELSQTILNATTRSSILATPPRLNKRNVIRPIARQRLFLQKACDLLDTHQEPELQIPTIAKAWGEQLLTLNPQQRVLAEKGINDILFEAKLETLHRHSISINEHPQWTASSFPVTTGSSSTVPSFSNLADSIEEREITI